MKHPRSDMPVEIDNDSDKSQEPLALDTRISSTRTGHSINQHNSGRQHYSKVIELPRPIWPANDVITPAISQKKIKQLECGNEEENLMAAFARHVIKPGRNSRKNSWVSHRSLRKAFPEHFDQSGFVTGSTWKNKKASDFGLPDLFFRGVDDRTASLGHHERVKYLFADLGWAPATDPWAGKEYQRLQQRNVHEHSSSVGTEQPRSFAISTQRKQSSQQEIGLDAVEGREDYIRPSKRLRSRSPVQSQSGVNTEEISAMPQPTCTAPDDMVNTPIKLDSLENVRPNITYKTSPLESRRITGWMTRTGDGHVRTASPQHDNRGVSAKERIMQERKPEPLQQDQVETIDQQAQSQPVQPATPLVANDIRAAKKMLVPKLCDILRDFPTAPEDERFVPLLRILAQATVANTPQAIEDKHLDLLDYVITHCTSSSPTDHVEIASLTRPILRILMKYRYRMATETHSRMQRDVNNAALRRDMERLRAIYAEMLFFEAQDEEGQKDQ